MKKGFALLLSTICAFTLFSCTGNLSEQVIQGEPGIDGVDGEDGKDGTSLLTGHGTPSSTLGNDNDSYIDLDTWDFYVKTNGSWEKKEI